MRRPLVATFGLLILLPTLRAQDKSKDKSQPQTAPENPNLAIGKPAPEIAGEDIDGKQFKLSDYRGKVVLLDFWGHW
jgi:cytochrome oxidase Cu insertion factor (SCO1/SenC/PrrC family)